MMKLKKVLLLAGPTASGKTDLSIRAASRICGGVTGVHAEIINSDSVQMYRECNVASNKISYEQRQHIPHHLIDSVSLRDTSDEDLAKIASSGWFCNRVRCLLGDICARNAIPIIVGGSAFYNEMLFRGTTENNDNSNNILDTPNENNHSAYLKNRILNLEQLKSGERSWDDLYSELNRIAPNLAQGITPNNYVRLYRAFEKVQQQQQHLNQLDSTLVTSPVDPVFHPNSPYDVRAIALYADRLYLYEIIGLRCEKIIQSGLLEETYDLLKQGILTPNTVPYNAIGYRQSISFIEECLQNNGAILQDMAQLRQCFLKYVADYKTATRNYAKKQYNWFRRGLSNAENLESSPLFPPPKYMWLNVNNLLQSALHDPSSLEESFDIHTTQLLQLFDMPKDEYENMLSSNENTDLANKSKGASSILSEKYAQEMNCDRESMKVRRRVISELDILMNKLHLFSDEQVLQHKLQSITQMLSI